MQCVLKLKQFDGLAVRKLVDEILKTYAVVACRSDAASGLAVGFLDAGMLADPNNKF